LTNIGLFCGTFNPIHFGHLLIAECARDQFKLDKVIFVTSPRPPHREDVHLDGQLRHDMVALAVADNPMFEASSVEIEQPGPSYTIQTITHFRSFCGPRSTINLLIGGDNVSQLETWHRIDEIYQLTKLLIAPRATKSIRVQSEDKSKQKQLRTDLKTIERQGANYSLIEFPLVDISSSMIRSRLATNRSVLYMVPPAVNQILVSKGYYRNPQTAYKNGTQMDSSLT
jgi:nicotinate-nucleotide adenylyltransferase